MKRELVLLIYLLISNVLFGQIEMPGFRPVGTKEGLPEGFVHSIICDRSGLIWIASYEGLYQYNGYQIKPFHSQGKEDTQSLSSQRVFSLLEDHNENIWVGTTMGVNRMDRNTGKFKRYLNKLGEAKQFSSNTVQRIFEDSKSRIWAASSKGLSLFNEKKQRFEIVKHADSSQLVCYTLFELNGENWFAGNWGIYHFNESKKQLEPLVLADNKMLENCGPILCSLKDPYGTIWLGTFYGLFKFDVNSATILPSDLKINEDTKYKVNSMIWFNNSLWIGTSKGLINIDPKTQNRNNYHYMSNNPSGLPTNYIQSLSSDNNGNIWVGTSLSAASFQVKYKPISFYFLNPNLPLNDAGNHANRVFEDSKGRIWTWNGTGIYKSAGLGYEMVPINGKPYPYFLECFVETPIKGVNTLLISYSSPGKGLFFYNESTNAAQRFPLNEKLDKMGIYHFETELNNREHLLLGTWEGLCVFNIVTKDTQWIRPGNLKNAIRGFTQLADGTLILSHAKGYSIYKNIHAKEEAHLYNPESANMFNSGMIRDIRSGKNGNLWLSTETGLTFYNAQSQKYYNYTSSKGLKGGSIIYAMHTDNAGNCWFVTNSYLIKLDPVTGRFQYFNSSDGVHTTFNRWSYFQLKNGTVLFGGINGIVAFNPESMIHNTNLPKIVLTDFRVNNKQKHYGILPENINEVTVSFAENALTFEFAALEYASTDKNEYAYRMTGFDTGWIFSGNERRVSYTNLSPGTYYFEVKCTNSEGKWNENNLLRIRVIVTPLYYQTWWFKGIIILLIGGLVYLFYRNKKQKRELEQQMFVAEQNTKYKSKFLTNMSHEIRTPMNAIIGLNRLLLNSELDEKQKKYAAAVQQSSENLLWIVNDILDQAKIESGKYTIINKPFQLDVILKQIHNLLLIKAEEKGLNFKFEISNNLPLKLTGDPVRLYQILTNLVANAIKFTHQGQVSLFAESVESHGGVVNIKFMVKDTGIGIPKDHLHQIFDSFNQLDSDDASHAGTGLGLTIARELILQMNGEIAVESELKKGTLFTVTLPFKIDTSASIEVDSSTKNKKSNKKLKVLIVDDTRFNILLAQELIADQFPHALSDVAENGKIAIEKIHSNDYDIVLMDVKMPVMDGIEATRIIRNMTDTKKCNLPILGLTANAIPEQLEACYNAGMNDYLTKPVNAQELFNKMDQLTNQCQ